MITKSNSTYWGGKRRILQIYLADPVHNFVQSRDIWTIPLNVLTIASYAKAAFGDQVRIQVFKFPDLIFKAIKEMPPDIIGVSNYIWNCELSKAILGFAKEQCRETITVMGGPNVTQIHSWMTRFLKEANCDYYIIGAGEHPFKCLVGSVLKSRKIGDVMQQKTQDIHGVWYLDRDTKETVSKPVTYIIKDLDEIPSPFQNGTVDEFFKQGLMPMIETNRGCPFPCTYCDWGDSTFGQIYKYSIERVQSDIKYCCHNTDDERLMVNDANYGLLGKRDLEIAKFITHLRDTYGWPGKVILTWGQTKSDVMLQIADTLKGLCMMTQSSQSMNPEVLKNIKRKNISDTQWKKSVSFCKERKIDTYGELMLPLPGETLESFSSAIRYLFDLGVDFININPLMLLEGSEMNTVNEREKCQFVTKWRLLENCYGIYEGRTAIEHQEMVIQTNSFYSDDYFLCRVLSWLIQMSWNLCRHDLLLCLVQSFGVNPLDFLLKAVRDFKKASPAVRTIFENFFNDAHKELFATKDALISFNSSSERLEFLRRGGFCKLNTHYTSRVSLECNSEFIDYYEALAYEIINSNVPSITKYNDMIKDCARFVQQRYLTTEDLANLESGNDINKMLIFHYDIVQWSLKINGEMLWDYHCPDGITYHFYIDSEQLLALRKHIRRFSGISREYQLRKLQEPYHGIHKKHLLFRIEQIKKQKMFT